MDSLQFHSGVEAGAGCPNDQACFMCVADNLHFGNYLLQLLAESVIGLGAHGEQDVVVGTHLDLSTVGLLNEYSIAAIFEDLCVCVHTKAMRLQSAHHRLSYICSQILRHGGQHFNDIHVKIIMALITVELLNDLCRLKSDNAAAENTNFAFNDRMLSGQEVLSSDDFVLGNSGNVGDERYCAGRNDSCLRSKLLDCLNSGLLVVYELYAKFSALNQQILYPLHIILLAGSLGCHIYLAAAGVCFLPNGDLMSALGRNLCCHQAAGACADNKDLLALFGLTEISAKLALTAQTRIDIALCHLIFRVTCADTAAAAGGTGCYILKSTLIGFIDNIRVSEERTAKGDAVNKATLNKLRTVNHGLDLTYYKDRNIDYLINRCIGCNEGCLDGFANLEMPHISCTRNPQVGLEGECPIEPAAEPKTVLIAGGGTAGMMAAKILKQEGHNPIICEASDKLGGALLLGGAIERTSEYRKAIESSARQLERAGVDIRLNTTVTPELIKQIKPDAVFCCLGAVPETPDFAKGKVNVVQARDVLAGKVHVGGKVVVIGANGTGIMAGEFVKLADPERNDVTLINRAIVVGVDLGSARKQAHATILEDESLKQSVSTDVTDIVDGKVIGVRDGETVEFPYDYAILATGCVSKDYADLENACAQLGIGFEVLGDAKEVRRAFEAAAEGFAAARRMNDPEYIKKITK